MNQSETMRVTNEWLRLDPENRLRKNLLILDGGSSACIYVVSDGTVGKYGFTTNTTYDRARMIFGARKNFTIEAQWQLPAEEAARIEAYLITIAPPVGDDRSNEIFDLKYLSDVIQYVNDNCSITTTCNSDAMPKITHQEFLSTLTYNEEGQDIMYLVPEFVHRGISNFDVWVSRIELDIVAKQLGYKDKWEWYETHVPSPGCVVCGGTVNLVGKVNKGWRHTCSRSCASKSKHI